MKMLNKLIYAAIIIVSCISFSIICIEEDNPILTILICIFSIGLLLILGMDESKWGWEVRGSML